MIRYITYMGEVKLRRALFMPVAQERSTRRKHSKVNDQAVMFFSGHGHIRMGSTGEKYVETGFIAPVGSRTEGEAL